LPRAQRDFRTIIRYSLAVWGQRQSEAYRARIADALQELGAFPNLGRARDEIAPGLRSLTVADHVIYYRVNAEEIAVIRIAHAKLDPVDLNLWVRDGLIWSQEALVNANFTPDLRRATASIGCEPRSPSVRRNMRVMTSKRRAPNWWFGSNEKRTKKIVWVC
jgi:toxin ParE1/3/4